MDLFLPSILLFGFSLWFMVRVGKWLGRKPIQPLWIVIGTMLALAVPTLTVVTILKTLEALHIVR